MVISWTPNGKSSQVNPQNVDFIPLTTCNVAGLDKPKQRTQNDQRCTQRDRNRERGRPGAVDNKKLIEEDMSSFTNKEKEIILMIALAMRLGPQAISGFFVGLKLLAAVVPGMKNSDPSNLIDYAMSMMEEEDFMELILYIDHVSEVERKTFDELDDSPTNENNEDEK